VIRVQPSAHKQRELSTGLALIPRVDFGDAIQYVHSSRLPRDVGVVIVFGQRRARVIGAIFCCNLLQLSEELIQFSPFKPPIEQVADLLCWFERLVSKRRGQDNKSDAALL
jgi:hypothetical protein